MPSLSLSHLQKSFGPLTALADASLELGPSEIHAILGENGAGKTTLMNILYGLLEPDGGEMDLDGKPYSPRSPQDARQAGIGMVHQHFMLVPTLSVGENILLGERPLSLFRRKSAFDSIREKMSALGFQFPLEARTEDLSVGELQRVEIFKALWKGANLLILDEPTAVLTPQEITSLFDLLHGLRNQGHSILFISHKLEEIERLCNRVSLLRKGKTVGCFEVRETDRRELSRLMLGREVEAIHRRGPHEHTFSGSTSMAHSSDHHESFTFACRGTEGTLLHGDWRMEIPCGRITALVGVEGNGQGELVRSILGLISVPGVELSIGGEPLPAGVHARIAAGVGLIPEDRQRTGLVLDFTLAENLALKDIERAPWSRSGWLSPSRAMEETVQRIRRFDIQPPDPGHPAAALSGGNQQKVVAAREISRPHRLLVAVNPTRGLDAGACETVHTALAADADSGAAILLITTEIEEALALADQFCVLFRGHVSLLPRSDWTQEKIGLAMMGVSEPTRFLPSDPSNAPASPPVAP